MTIRSIADAIAEIQPESAEAFIPTRYPYTYACDYLRGHPHIIPDEVLDLWPLRPRDPMSRADASLVRELWASLTGVSDAQSAILLADAYLKAAGMRVSYGDKCDALAARAIDVDSNPEQWSR